MRKWLLFLVLLVASCVPYDPVELTGTAEQWTPEPTSLPDPEPTPTQEIADPFCYGIPGDGFVNIADNQCLKWPVETTASPGPFQADVIQWIPLTGWDHYNRQKCLTDTAGEYTGIAPILWDEGYNFRVMFEAMCGYWGYQQVVTVTDPGCYIGKFGYDAYIVDPEWASHDYNYALFLTVIRADGEKQTIKAPVQVNGIGDTFVTIRLANPGEYIIRMGVHVSYGSAKADSFIGLQSLSFAWDMDGDHCHSDTLGL